MPLKPFQSGPGAMASASSYQPDGSLGYDLHLPLDRKLGLKVCLVLFEVDARKKRFDVVDGFQNVPQVGLSVPKRQGSPHSMPWSESVPSSTQPRKDRPALLAIQKGALVGVRR